MLRCQLSVIFEWYSYAIFNRTELSTNISNIFIGLSQFQLGMLHVISFNTSSQFCLSDTQRKTLQNNTIGLCNFVNYLHRPNPEGNLV